MTCQTNFLLQFANINHYDERRIMTHDCDYYVPGSVIIRDLGWQDVATRKKYLSAILVYKCIYNQTPNYMSDHLVYASEVHTFSTGNANRGNLYLPQPSTDYYSCGLSTATIEHSCPSVCLSVCPSVCVSVCVCVSVYTMTQKIMVQST